MAMKTKTISLDGLRHDQVARLTRMRNEMLGWEFVGCAVDIDDDYFWCRGARVRGLGEAELFKDAAAAEKAIEARIRSGPDDERELTVVGVYRKDDEWQSGPCLPLPMEREKGPAHLARR
jgi:hypothetical protein